MGIAESYLLIKFLLIWMLHVDEKEVEYQRLSIIEY